MKFQDFDCLNRPRRKRHRKRRRKQKKRDPRRRQRVRRATLRPMRGLVVDRVEVVAAGREGVRFDVCRN